MSSSRYSCLVNVDQFEMEDLMDKKNYQYKINLLQLLDDENIRNITIKIIVDEYPFDIMSVVL